MKLAPSSTASLHAALAKIAELYSGEEDQLVSTDFYPLFKLCLFHCKFRQILSQIFNKLINALSSYIVYHENAVTSSIF